MRFLYILLPLIYCTDPTIPGVDVEAEQSPAVTTSTAIDGMSTTDGTSASAEAQTDGSALSAEEVERLDRRRRAYEAAMARIKSFSIGSGAQSPPVSPVGGMHRSTTFTFDASVSAPMPSLQSASKGPGHRGLSNLGMTCFINSAVQILMNAQPIREIVRGINPTALEEEAIAGTAAGAPVWKRAEKSRLAKAFVDLTNLYWSGDNTTVVDMTENIRSVATALTELDPLTFVRYRMGDSHEVIKAILDAFPLDPSLPDSLQNPIESLFEIVGEQKTKFCTVCESSESSKYEPLSDFLVKTELVGARESVNLQEYIASVLERPVSETIEGVECTACSTEANSTVTRTVRLDTATVVRGGGSLLLVTLPRFQNGSVLKNTVSIEIPTELTLVEDRFDIVGIVYHTGSSLNFGHYTASFVDHVDKKWYNANDGSVREIESPVLVGETPYLVLYQRRLD